MRSTAVERRKGVVGWSGRRKGAVKRNPRNKVKEKGHCVWVKRRNRHGAGNCSITVTRKSRDARETKVRETHWKNIK